MIRILSDLDNSDGNHFMISYDYYFSSQICDNRNHNANNVFTVFIYNMGWENSRDYQKQFDKLEKDNNRVVNESNILEKRIDYCKMYRR